MSQVRPVILAAFAGILTAVSYGGEAVAANNVWLCNFPGFQETTYIYDDQTKEGLTVGNVGESPYNRVEDRSGSLQQTRLGSRRRSFPFSSRWSMQGRRR